MGFFSPPAFLKIAEWAADQDRNAVVTGTVSPLSPTSDGQLARVVLDDIFGAHDEDPNAPVPREMGMRQPAFARARGVLLSLMARYPYVAWRGETRLDPQPRWLSRTDTGIPPQKRMADTFDDVFWRGRSLWLLLRGPGATPDPDAPPAPLSVAKLGPILDAVHMPWGLWKFDSFGNVLVSQGPDRWSEEPLPIGSHIVFEGFQEGLLTMAASVIRTGDGIQRSIAARAKSPIPMINLHLEEALALTAAEKEALRAQWVRARNNPDGAVAITPHNVTAEVMGSDASEFLDAARNSQRIDAANMTHVPAGILDGTTSTASLTYSTQEGKRVELVDYGLNMWRTVFESRLSMDDVTPAGTRIELDLSDLYQLPAQGTGPQLED